MFMPDPDSPSLNVPGPATLVWNVHTGSRFTQFKCSGPGLIGKEVPGSGQILIWNVHAGSGSTQFKCSGPGHIGKEVPGSGQICIWNVHAGSGIIQFQCSGSTSLPVAWCRAVGRHQLTADDRRMRAGPENKARPSSCLRGILRSDRSAFKQNIF